MLAASSFGHLSGSHLMFEARLLLKREHADGTPIRGSVSMRAIGSVFTPQTEGTYVGLQQPPNHFDHLLFIRETTPSRTLPLVN